MSQCTERAVWLRLCGPFQRVQRTRASVRRAQFTDEHGEVCPANWRPGGATIKPDPKGSKTYFASQKA